MKSLNIKVTVETDNYVCRKISCDNPSEYIVEKKDGKKLHFCESCFLKHITYQIYK